MTIESMIRDGMTSKNLESSKKKSTQTTKSGTTWPQTISKSTLSPKNSKFSSKKHNLTPETIAKGASALETYRAEKAAAIKAGGAALKKWEEAQAAKKASKGLTPMTAIKAFCITCVGDNREDVRNCTSFKCPLYTFRPYK